MKKIRLSSSNMVDTNQRNVVETRIHDIPSPSSPFRKQSAGEYDVMKYAVNAPLENNSTFNSVPENDDIYPNNYIESAYISTQFIADTLVLNSESLIASKLPGEKVIRFDDSYTNDELKLFIRRQEAIYAVTMTSIGCELEQKNCHDNLLVKDRSFDFDHVQLFKPSDDEIVRYLRSL